LTGSHLFDPGLQPERTALAWRRTVLALAVGSIVALRLLSPVLGVWSIAIGLAGLALATVMWGLAGRRAAQASRALLHAAGHLPGAGLLLFLALTIAAAAALGLIYVALASGT
jgi:putative membrane protein